jgi:hypothetical protein
MGKFKITLFIFALLFSFSSQSFGQKIGRGYKCTSGIKGKRAVAEHLMSRVKDKRFPNTVCGVIHAKGQYFPYGTMSEGAVIPDILKVAKDVLTTKKSNGFLGFRSYCRSGHGDQRIGGNCYRKSADIIDLAPYGSDIDVASETRPYMDFQPYQEASVIPQNTAVR